MAKGALVGGPVIGAAQGATANIPRAVASGNPADAVPDRDAIVESMIGNSIGMGALGGVHAGAERALGKLTGASEAPVDKAPAEASNTRLADLIKTKAEENGLDLKRVNYADPAGAKVALDATHDALAEQIKPLWDVVKEAKGLDPRTASDLDGLLDRSGFMATMRSARNKVKGSISDADLERLNDVVGDTEEGRQLVDLTRQANQLSELFRQGLKGGVSQYTDHLNPFGHGGRETGYTSILRAVAPKAVEAGALIHNPAIAVPMVAGYAGGRAIDALTGRRSTVAKFVRDNSTPATPIDMTGARSILAQKAAFKASADAQRTQAEQARALKLAQTQYDKQQAAAEAVRARKQASEDAARLAAREQELRTQNRLDNNPGLGGFDRSIYDQTGIKPADALPGVFELFRTGRITPTEFHSFFDSPHDLMKGNAGNHIIDMLDQLARKGTVERDPEWNQGASARPEQPQGGSIRNPAAYKAQADGNQLRVTVAQTRVAASPHSPEVKGIINDAAAAIGRTNNRADAEHVRQSAAQALAAHSPEAVSLAHQELGPLVEQIRHPGTPEPVTASSLMKSAKLNAALNSTTALYNHGVRPAGSGLFEPPGKRFKTGPRTGPDNLRDLFPGLKGITPFLTESERQIVTKRNAQTLIDAFDKLPDPREMASVAYSGRAKRGWYNNSARAIVHIFGANDGSRFATLLAATSPQCSVETNLINALNIWAGWTEAGRPTDRASIIRIMGENVQGDKGADSILDAWTNNSLRALSSSDGERVTISGPKVSSFAANLQSDVHEVTNDAWMANYANVEQEMFKGRERDRDEHGTIAGKTPGYLAMNALARKAASAASKLTGETWTPAEIQETVWSWAKALYEKADARGETRSATEIVKQQALTHGEINSVPDFEKLLVQEAYKRILDKAGYSEQIASLGGSNPQGNASDVPGGTPFSTEGTGISPTAHLQYLVRAAKRLDALRTNRRADKSNK
jgi:hypothetical protein